MELAGDSNQIEIDFFLAMTLGIVVYFCGEALTKRISFLRAYSIPEPVSGGLLAAFVTLAVVYITGREVKFDLAARDLLLVYFFTTVGLNASFRDLLRGGPILAVMLGLTVGYMVLQSAIGILGAIIWGMPSQAGVMMGTASLMGGHGTSIAWGPVVDSSYGVVGAAELGIASATVGLIMASLLGGPIAKFLIERWNLTPEKALLNDDAIDIGESSKAESITSARVMRCIFWIHVAIILGYIAYESLEEIGINLPLFVPCLIMGILLSNSVPRIFPSVEYPARTPSMALVAEFSLSVFLAMSLMSMELWSLASNAGVLITTMVLQALVASVFIVFVVFRVMGQNYFAAVISSGFAGFALGATPTAIANMNAVTQRYGPAPLAFIVLPLISAFFVDIVNALLIQFFLNI